MKLDDLLTRKTVANFEDNYNDHGDILVAMVESCLSNKCTPDELLKDCITESIMHSGGPKTLKEFQIMTRAVKKLTLK